MKKTLVIAIVIAIISLLAIRVIVGKHKVSEASVTKARILGIAVQKSDDKGVLITAVHANSMAEQKGLKYGDIILAINKKPVEDVNGYQRLLDKALMKDKVTYSIKRPSGEVKVIFDMESAAVYNSLGNAYMKDNQYEQAINSYKKSLEMDPEFAEAHYNLGSAYAQQKKYDLAVENFKEAIKLRTDFREAYYKLADVYSKQEKNEEAIKTYREIIQTTPADTVASDLQPVEVISATTGDIKNQLKFSGSIEPRALVLVYPKAIGEIEQMKVDQGHKVKKGQVLAVVEHEELDLQLQQAEAAVAAAQAGYDQTVQLAETQIMSQFAQASAGKEAGEAALQQVRDLSETRVETQIQQAKAALDALQANLEKIRNGAREEEREQVRATVAQAEANLANAQSNYDRMKGLYDAGAISRQTYEGIQTHLEVVKAQSQAAKEQWNMIEQGAREEDIQAIEAQVKQAKAGFELASKQAEKFTWEKDIAMAEAQANQARAAMETAKKLVEAKSWEAEITAAKTQLIQAKVGRDLVRKQLDNTYIKSPINGIISQRHVDEGNMASSAAPLFEIVDMDEVHATVDILEADLNKIQIGRQAWIHVSSMDDPVESRVTSISPTIDKMTRTAKVEVTADNAEHMLKPGMFAQLLIPVDARSSTILLPRSAVMEDDTTSKKYVFVANSGRGRKTNVEYGLTEGNLVEIVRGINAGDQVIIAGQQRLNDGDFVQIIKVIESL